MSAGPPPGLLPHTIFTSYEVRRTTHRMNVMSTRADFRNSSSGDSQGDSIEAIPSDMEATLSRGPGYNSSTQTSSQSPEITLGIPAAREKLLVDDSSSHHQSLDERESDIGTVAPTNDTRPEIATFKRRQVEMLPICIPTYHFQTG